MNTQTLAVITAIFLFTFSSTVRADQPTHGVEIIKQAWYPGPCLSRQKSPYQAENDSFRPSEERGRESESESFMQVRASRLGSTPSQYYYTVKIKNTGPKEIKEVVWEYVFSNPQTGTEMHRHTFRNEVELLPGRTKSLEASSLSAPTKVIDVRMLTNAKSDNYLERVQIRRVAYKDGSVWEAN